MLFTTKGGGSSSCVDLVTVELRLFLSHIRTMQVLNFMRAGVV